MNIVMMIILAVVSLVVYAALNVVIRRMVAGVRSREDYDEDVDGKMTEAEKQAASEQKVLELDKKRASLGEVIQEYGRRFYMVAFLGAVLGGLTGLFFGLSIETVIFYIFFGILTVIAFIDMDTMEIPPVLNIIILVLGIISIWTTPDIPLRSRIIGLVSVSGFMLIMDILFVLLAGVNAFGGGDIKLMAAAGLLLGWKGILTAFMVGIFVGAIIGIVLMARKKKGGREHIPFGPSLCVGLVVAALTKGYLVEWYLGMAKSMMHNASY